MDGLRPGSQERIRHIVEERRIRFEVLQCESFKLETLAFEVIVDEVNHVALCYVGAIDGLEVGKNLLRGLSSRLIDKRLWIGICLCQVDRLQKLS